MNTLTLNVYKKHGIWHILKPFCVTTILIIFQWLYTIVNVGDSHDTQSTANVQPPKSVTLTAIPAACHIRSAWSGCQNSKRNLGCEKRSVYVTWLSAVCFDSWSQKWKHIPICSMVQVYLPTKLGDFVRGNVGIHIPAPWFAYGIGLVSRFSWAEKPTRRVFCSGREDQDCSTIVSAMVAFRDDAEFDDLPSGYLT